MGEDADWGFESSIGDGKERERWDVERLINGLKLRSPRKGKELGKGHNVLVFFPFSYLLVVGC